MQSEVEHCADTSPAFFEAIYRKHEDPWGFATNPHERARYDALLSLANERSFGRALEPGCSIGVLTARLARVCAAVDAVEGSASAVQRARRRCASLANVNVIHGLMPQDIPLKRYDLLVFSEFGYYFDEQALRELCIRFDRRLVGGALVLGCHWLGDSADHRLAGKRVHEIIDEMPRWRARPVALHTDKSYLLGAWDVSGASPL